MDSSDPIEEEGVPPLAESGRRLAHRLLTIGENRLQLLIVEAQEERIRIKQAMLLTTLMIFFALLAGFALTLLVAVIFWNNHPVLALGILTGVYALGAVVLYARLAKLCQDWQTFPGTLDQLKKDRECLEKQLH